MKTGSEPRLVSTWGAIFLSLDAWVSDSGVHCATFHESNGLCRSRTGLPNADSYMCGKRSYNIRVTLALSSSTLRPFNVARRNWRGLGDVRPHIWSEPHAIATYMEMHRQAGRQSRSVYDLSVVNIPHVILFFRPSSYSACNTAWLKWISEWSLC